MFVLGLKGNKNVFVNKDIKELNTTQIMRNTDFKRREYFV